MSHAIPLRVFQVLKCDRWYSAVFELALVCAVGELHAKFAWRWCRRRPRMPRRGPVVPLVRSTPVVRGVLLWLARFVPCVRYKVLPAWILGGETDTKFSLLGVLLTRAVQNSPCAGKTRQIGPFRVRGESFIPDMRRGRVCGESFIPDMRREGVSGESFIPDMRRGRVCGESFIPMRRGVVLVGRIRSCSGVVLVPVGGLWRHPAAARGCRSQASGALHTCGARCAEGDPRRLKAPARPRRRPRVPQPGLRRPPRPRGVVCCYG